MMLRDTTPDSVEPYLTVPEGRAMPVRAITLAVLCFAAVVVPVRAATMSGTSWTSADDLLFLKMLTALTRFSERQYGCGDISDIRSKILNGYKDPSPRPDDAVGPLHYERWLVTMCGKKRVFTFTLFRIRNGGTAWIHNNPPK
jgi:hypothetical protein